MIPAKAEKDDRRRPGTACRTAFKSTVSRLLHVLRRFEFLEQNPQSKKFSLGQAADKLGKALNRSYDAQLVAAAGPQLDDLRSRLQETVVLEVLSGNSTILVYVAEGPGPSENHHGGRFKESV